MFVDYLSPMKRNRIKKKLLKEERELKKSGSGSKGQNQGKQTMKIVFAGTPEFAGKRSRIRSIRGGHQVELVLTQPDRPAGRGMKLQPSAVKKLAISHDIPVEQPVSLRFDGKHAEEAKRVYELVRQIEPDVMVVVAYGLILPKAFLGLPEYGCLKTFTLPCFPAGGAAPIQRAIEAGDTETGVSIMQMEEGLDTGPVLVSESIPIDHQNINAAELHDKLADLGGRLILAALKENGRRIGPSRHSG